MLNLQYYKNYLKGFVEGFGCHFSFWNEMKLGTTNTSIITNPEDLNNNVWNKTCLDFRQAFDDTMNKYGFDHEK